MNKPLLPDVTVNGVAISATAIAAEAQNHAAPKGKPGLAWKAAARALVVRELLLQEAARLGLDPDCEEVAPGKRETKEEALIRAVTETAISGERPSAEEVRAHWAKDPTRYTSPPLWEVSHILCSGEDGATRAAAITERLAGSPKAFGALAAEQSDCPSGKQGGALGQLSPGDTVPEFEAALRDLQEGELTAAPVETRFGWHIIRMDGLAPSRVLPFEAAAPAISEALEKARWAKEARDFVADLLGNAEVVGVDLAPSPAS